MPITLNESIEPLSPRSLRGTTRPTLIRSDAFRLLLQEARRYLAGAVRGRSFLVAGHRGSGKTTLVLHVCQELLDTPHLVASQRPLRPMIVLLHGPNLLSDAAGAGKEPSEANGAGEESEQPDELGTDESQNALIQITLGLYRALASEMTAAFRSAVESRAVRSRRELVLSRRELLEHLELAAQLELELDRCPEPARLREFWERAGLLPGGVLSYPREVDDGFGRGSSNPFWWPPDDQGFRELLALSSACEMYRRISGTFSDKETRKRESEAKASVGANLDSKGQNLLGPLVSIATGGLVGAGAAAGEAGGLAATLAGLVSALGAATVFQIASSRRQDRTLTAESVFVRDMTVASLDRELPVLIERCRQAGLVPLFVVDELDKVTGLSQRITSLVRRLKKLVAERAFFCFLADRSYFEEMSRRTERSAYPIEYTYFTHRVFVTFGPENLHEWLGQVLKAPKVQNPVEHAIEHGRRKFEAAADRERPGTPVDPTPLQDETSGSRRGHADVAADELEDLKTLPYVLLHQAKMHPIDLRRRLAELFDEQREFVLPPGKLRTRGNLCDLVIQVAVEAVLAGEEVRAVVRRDPTFRRLVYDALYHPSRLWERAEYELDLRDGREEEFGRVLVERMGASTRTAAAQGEETEGDEAGDQDDGELQAGEIVQVGPVGERETRAGNVGADPVAEPHAAAGSEKAEIRADGPTLAPADRDFLFGQARHLCRLLADEKAFTAAYDEWRQGRPFGEAAGLSRSMIESALKLVFPLLEEDADETGLYRWLRDRAGMPRPAATDRVEADALAAPDRSEAETSVIGPVDAKSVLAQAAKIRAFVGFLEDILDGDQESDAMTLLTSDLHVLPTAPAWSETRHALERLDRVKPEEATAEDLQTVREFFDLLVRNWKTIALALPCAEALGTVAAGTPGQRFSYGLRALSAAWRFWAQEEATKLVALDSVVRLLVADELIEVEVWQDPPPALEGLEVSKWTKWHAQSRGALESLNKDRIILVEQQRRAWSAWAERFEHYLASRETVFPPDLPDLWCAAAVVPPSAILKYDLSRMTISEWSGLVWWASEYEMPIWIIVPALYSLGFRLPREKVSVLSDGPEETMRRWASYVTKLPGAQASPHVLMLTSDESARLAWAPPRHGALIRMGPWDLTASSPELSPQFFQLVTIDALAIELPWDIDVPSQFSTPDAALKALHELVGQEVPHLWVADDKLVDTPDGTRTYSPHTAEGLIKLASSLVEPTETAKR